MKTRLLGNTGLAFSILSFGDSSIGAEFRAIDVADALKCAEVALDLGISAPYSASNWHKPAVAQAVAAVDKNWFSPCGSPLSK